MFRQAESRTSEPIPESSTMNSAYTSINLRAEMMSEASRLIQTARASSSGPERVSTISQPRSGTISPVSAYQNSQPRHGAISPPEISFRTAQRHATTSPVSANRHVQPPPEKVPSVDVHSRTIHLPDQKSVNDAYPNITPRPAAPHIASMMKSLPDKKSEKQASSNIMPRLEMLVNSHVSRKVQARPRSTTPVDLTSEIIPYPERVLMGTPCLRLDMPPGEDSDDGADAQVDAQRGKVAKSGTAIPTKPVLDTLPSFRLSTKSTSQKKPRSAVLLTENVNAKSIPQEESWTEKIHTKNPRTATKSPRKYQTEKPPAITSEHEILFRSRPNLKVNTPLEGFSRTGKDTEKALPAKPPAATPDPPSDFLSSQISRPRGIAFIFLVCMLQIIPQAALTICFPISSIIAGAFKIKDASILPWMVAAYATTFGTFIFVSARLGDMFGHKKLVIVGFIMMTPWSVVAGISHMVSPVLFFVARAMQGVAASLMVPNGLALLERTYAPGSKMKIIAFSLSGLCAPLGAYLGMLLAAIFADSVGGFFVFFVLAGMSLLCAIAFRFVVIPPPPTPAQMKPLKEKLGDMDWLGAFTGVAGMICVQVALVSAPRVGWGTSWIYMLLIIGALFVAGFVVVEIKIAENPLMPFRIMSSDVAFVLAAVACGWAVWGIWLWYLWRYLLGIRHYAPLESAVHVLPIVPVTLLASILTASLMRTTKPAYVLLYATLAAILGVLLLYFAAPTQTYWGCTFVSLLVMPIFMGLSLPAVTDIMSNLFPMHMQGISSSLIATVLNYSISFGLGLATTAEVYTSRGPTPQLTGIHGAWLTGVGIGAFGVLICAVYLFQSIRSPPNPARPPTIHQRKVASVLRTDAEHDNAQPQPTHSKSSASRSLRRKPSITTSLGRIRHRFSTTGLGFAAAFPLSQARRPSASSMDSSLFPLTRTSSASTERPQREPIPRRESDALTITALPNRRDRIMPPLLEARQSLGAAAAGATRYQQAQRVNVSQQARFLQGRRG